MGNTVELVAADGQAIPAYVAQPQGKPKFELDPDAKPNDVTPEPQTTAKPCGPCGTPVSCSSCRSPS